MSLFQKSVEKKYLSELDSALIEQKFKQFKTYFGNPQIQENIRNSKEEQFQEGFLRELFVSILGYTLKPQPNFNLTTELKNTANSKKADGAILKGEEAIAVIELKGTDTTDLDKIETQAFGYKNHNPKCVYVITSNFEKLRFYIQNAVDHIDFDLFNLTKEQFSLLWLCLSKDNLLNGLPLKIKESSVLQEENITKKLYTDYTKFREAIYTSLVKNNPDKDKLLLFKKTQKLLDRFLFIFFAEDRLLLPPNSISEIVKQWATLKDDLDEYVPLYDRFKKYFGYMNTGYVGKKYEIFAYNGGLFAPDEVLDNIAIDDTILYEHTLKLSQYDYETDVDVNILGHIFENSLGEIEIVQAEIKGEQIDTQKTKRKKDGIFYTPKYITKYIVENTVGKLCEEKRNELGIIDEEYAKGRKNRKKEIVADLDKKLTDYRNWLLTLTILDPACGSGAFLNQALDFLITEHHKIDELRAQLLGSVIVFPDFSSEILEKNIYGVDLNEESVEIAKLSLWLRTAQKGRKLNKLNNNIKCGNSLIDDPAVAGDKAFHWQKEFPDIFANGGFDVVIGNPPYVQLQSMGEMSDKLSKCGYLTYNKSADLYCLFYEIGCNLLKPKGSLGYITSNKWLRVNYGEGLRNFLVSKVNPIKLIDFPGVPVFADAVVDPHILILTKEPYKNETEACAIKKQNADMQFYFDENKITRNFTSQSWTIIPYEDARKLEVMKFNGVKLKELPITINYGIKTGYNEAFYIDEATKEKLIQADPQSAELIKPMVRGRDIAPYGITGFEYLINVHNGIKERKPPLLPIVIEDYPAIKKHLDAFYPMLQKRGDKGDTPYNLRNCAYLEEFSKPKIIYPNMTSVFPFMYDEKGFYSNDKSFILTANNDSVSLLYLTALFNSSLAKLWIWYNCPELGDDRREIRKIYFENFPVPFANDSQSSQIAALAKQRTSCTSDLQNTIDKFTRNLQRKFNLTSLSQKLQEWYAFSYSELVKEFAKNKIKLSLSDEAEWEDYFSKEKEKAKKLQAEIAKMDKEIDTIVYQLYGLTAEEIKIVEESA